MTKTLDEQLQQQLATFALESFRPGQVEVIKAVMSGRDCLCIMPTGGGKSLCYQLPAVARDGVTIVVSPLIALMKDQVDAMQARGVKATLINSTLHVAEQHQRMVQMAAGEYRLVYVAPERLRSPPFLEAVSRTPVRLLAVDEAHCISQWGHDFRPDYARLAEFRRRLGNPPTIALTATATPAVRDDVMRLLELSDPSIFITGFARPNLYFEVSHTSGAWKDEMLVDFVANARGAGILYVATRRGCDEIAELLRAALHRKVGVYHAGLRLEDRRTVQEAFMVGDIPIIVATNAFGMGINKADLRFVVHYNMPGSLEAYYQEAGRAGRDGLPARCLLLYSPEDRCIQEFFIENNYPSRTTVARVYEFLCGLDEDPIEVTQQDLKDRLSLEIGGEGIGACEQLLERCGAIERLATQENRASVRIQAPSPTLDQLLPKEAKTQRRVLRAVEQFVGAQPSERVYFSLEKLAELAGVPRDAVVRALRELRKLPGFDYVPPFRGRAVHVVDRQRPFDTLEIDFATLEKRKANEYDKLERMIGYAEASDCRQLRILDYFGDPNARDCGACDNCGPAPPVAEPTTNVSAPADQEDVVLQCIRMALSGVARTRGRVGTGLVAKMLCGSRSQSVRQLRLDQLSTFGLLAHLRQAEATSLLNALIQADLVEQTENQRNRPIVKLTSRGEKVMRGHLRLDPQVPLRAALRTKLRKIPLAQTAARAARTSQPVPSLGRIEQLAPSPPPADRPTQMGAPSPTNHPDYFWTWRVVSAGCAPDECAEIRRLDQAEVWKHLRQAAGAGLEVRAADVFTPAEISQLLLLASAGDHAARGRAEPRANPVTADQLAVFRSCQDRAARSAANQMDTSDECA